MPKPQKNRNLSFFELNNELCKLDENATSHKIHEPTSSKALLPTLMQLNAIDEKPVQIQRPSLNCEKSNFGVHCVISK